MARDDVNDLEYFRKVPAVAGGLWPGLRNVYFTLKKWSLEKETDPSRLVRKRVVMELNGTLMPGMAGSNAFMSFKPGFYDKIGSEDNKRLVRKALLAIVRSNRYSFMTRVMAAHACADTGVGEAAGEIRKLLGKAKRNSYEEGQLRRALEALDAGKTIYELLSSA